MSLIDPDYLKAVILASDLTYEQVAARAGVSKGLIGQLVTGKIDTLRPPTAYDIARALGVDHRDLFVFHAFGPGNPRTPRGAASKLAGSVRQVVPRTEPALQLVAAPSPTCAQV